MKSRAPVGRTAPTLVLATFLLVGCGGRPDLYCEPNDPCTAGHPACDVSGVCPASDMIANTCIPLSEVCWDAAPSDARLADGNSNSTDAVAPDSALIDSAQPPDVGLPANPFDVAFPRTLEVDTASFSDANWLRLVARGQPLDISVITVSHTTTNAPSSAVVTVSRASNDIGTLSAGNAWGALSDVTDPLIVGSGLMTETVQINGTILRLEISGLSGSFPPWQIDISMRAQGSVVTIPLTVEYRSLCNASGDCGWAASGGAQRRGSVP